MSAKANNYAREQPIRDSYKFDVLASVPMMRAPIHLEHLCERLHMTPEETATVMASYGEYPVPPDVAVILHKKIDQLGSHELESPPLFNTYAFTTPPTGRGGRRKRRRSHKKAHKKRRSTRRPR